MEPPGPAHRNEERRVVSILDFFAFGSSRPASADPVETETVRKIVDRLNHMDPEHARFVAAFAYVLSRVARADLRIDAEETRAMERIVSEHGGLPEDQAVIVVQLAKTQNLLFGGTENFLVTRELNRIASREQKLALLDCLFAISAADGSISTLEGGVIRQIAAELLLEHSDFIDVRRRYRDRLSVLERGPGEPEAPQR
jgi:uncharacterized tellurite resistance protein B-like protein